MGKSMVSRGTQSESPYEDEENSYKNGQYILETQEDLKKIKDTEHILNHLEKEGIIKNPKIDRYDTKILDNGTDKSHYHFFYDFEGSHNTLTKILNDYVEDNKINNKLINKIKEDILKKNTITQKGILDTRHEGYNLTQKETKLLKDNIDNFYYINKRGDKQFNFEHIEQDKALKGMKGNDKPINLLEGNTVNSLQGQYDYTFNFDKDLSIWEMEKLVEEKFKEQVFKTGSEVGDFKGYDFDLSKLSITQENNTIHIKFNNLFKGVDSNSFYMISNKNIKLLVESTFKEVEKDLDLNLNYRNRFYTDIEDINELMLDKSLKGSQLKVEIDPAAPFEKIEQQQETPQEEKVVEQTNIQETQKETVKPLEIDLKVYETKTIEEVSTEIETQNKLREEMTKFVEMSKMFGTYEDTKDKLDLGLNNITSKIEQLEEVVVEKEKLLLVDTLKDKVSSLETDLDIKDKEVNKLITTLSSKDTEIYEMKEEYGNFQLTAMRNIGKLQEEIETSTEIVSVLEEEVKELEIDLTLRDSKINVLENNNKGLTTDLTLRDKNIEIKNKELKGLETELITIKEGIETLTYTNTTLEKQVENLMSNIKTIKSVGLSQLKEISLKDTEIESLETNLDEVKRELKSIEKVGKEIIKDKSTEVETLKKQLEESQKKVVKLEKEKIDFTSSRDKLPKLGELDKLEQEIEDLDDTTDKQGKGRDKGEKPPRK